MTLLDKINIPHAEAVLRHWVPLRAFLIAALMVVAFAAALQLKPDSQDAIQEIPDLEQILPERFGDWERMQDVAQQVNLAVNREGETTLEQPYDATLSHTYRNAVSGQKVMLSIAYGRQQQQDVKIHRPEVCYPASGLPVESLKIRPFSLQQNGVRDSFDAYSMLAAGPGRTESVRYWVRIGSVVVNGALDARMEILKQGFSGKIPDGILIRTSMLIEDKKQHDGSIQAQDQFINQMLAAMSEKDRQLLLPSVRSEAR